MLKPGPWARFAFTLIINLRAWIHLHRGTSCLFIGICTTVRAQRYQAEHLGIISGLRGEDVGDERKEILGCCAFAPSLKN